MSFTTAQLQAIDDAIASGELSVSYEGKTVTYRSMQDLRSARDLIKADLQASGAAPARSRSSVASFSKD